MPLTTTESLDTNNVYEVFEVWKSRMVRLQFRSSIFCGWIGGKLQIYIQNVLSSNRNSDDDYPAWSLSWLRRGKAGTDYRGPAVQKTPGTRLQWL